jgi:hypothetical protein
MGVPYQRWIVIAIWVLFLGNAISQGISVRAVPNFASPDRPFLWILPVFGLLGPPLLAVLNFFALRRRSYYPGFVGRWIDRRWGQGSTFAFIRSLRPLMLLGCCGFVLGLIGFWSSWHIGAAVLALEISSFFMTAGMDSR